MTVHESMLDYCLERLAGRLAPERSTVFTGLGSRAERCGGEQRGQTRKSNSITGTF